MRQVENKKSSSTSKEIGANISNSLDALNEIKEEEYCDAIKVLLSSIESGQTVNLDYSIIKSNENIRLGDIDVSEDSFKQLVESIKQNGLLQNLVAELRINSKDDFDLVCVSGHRRLKALKTIPYKAKVPVKVILENRNTSALSENVHRKNLHFIEVASTYAKLKDSDGLSIKKMAQLFEKDPKYLGRFIKMGNWPFKIKKLILNNPEKLPYKFVWDNCAVKSVSSEEVYRTLKNKVEGIEKSPPKRSFTLKERRLESANAFFKERKVDEASKKIALDLLRELKII